MLGLYSMLEFKLCCEILLLLDMVVFYAEYRLVHSVHTNRLSACREFCGVHSWQNGTRCRYGVKVLWCHSHLVWLVFEDSIPTSFHSENFICDLFLLLFFFLLYCHLGMLREKRGGRGGQGGDPWSIKYDNIFCSHRTMNHHKFKCFQVKL